MQPAARRFVRVARHSAGSRSGRREPLNTMTIASSPTSTAALKRELKAAEARKR
ncbi:polyamine ABC transporter substrate-binding protein, partial [Burkholderia multivorans]